MKGNSPQSYDMGACVLYKPADIHLADITLADFRLADINLADINLADINLSDIKLADIHLADIKCMKVLYICRSHWKRQPG